MKKIKNNKGFTLMEMLIVVAIIAILVAIAIPSFTTQLEKAREAADIANIRSAYAEAMVKYLDSDTATFPVEAKSEKMTQKKAGWEKGIWPDYLGNEVDVTAGQIVTVSIADDGKVTCTAGAAQAGGNDQQGG